MNTLKSKLIILILFTSFSFLVNLNSYANAEDIVLPSTGKEFFSMTTKLVKKKKYYEYYELTKKAVDAGYAEGFYAMGYAYHKGLGVVDKDERKAIKWYRKAAEKDYTRAQLKLGSLLRYDNIDEAFKWLEIAANKNNSKAINSLGYLYGTGLMGNGLNYQEAVKWYEKSAKLGNKVGQYNLCLYYYLGRGVSMDSQKAEKWCQRSADQNYRNAIELLERIQAF